MPLSFLVSEALTPHLDQARAELIRIHSSYRTRLHVHKPKQHLPLFPGAAVFSQMPFQGKSRFKHHHPFVSQQKRDAETISRGSALFVLTPVQWLGTQRLWRKELPLNVRYNEGRLAAYYDRQVSNWPTVLLDVILQCLKEYGFFYHYRLF